MVVFLGLTGPAALAGPQEELAKIEAEKAQMAERQAALARQEAKLRARLRLEVPLDIKAKILAAFKDYIKSEPTENWPSWQKHLQDSFILILQNTKDPKFYDLYIGWVDKNDAGYDGYGLTYHNDELHVYVDHDNIQIGPEYVSENLYTWATETRREYLESQHAESHPRLRDAVISQAMNAHAAADQRFRTSLEAARARASNQRTRLVEKIVRDGVPYQWLVQEIKDKIPCTAAVILGP